MLAYNMFWTLITIISTMVEWIVFSIVVDVLNERKKNILSISVSIIINIIITTFLTIKNIDPNIRLFIGVIIGYGFYIYNYRTNILKGIIISLAYWMILIGMDFISGNIILLINSKSNISELLNNDMLKLELIIISKLLLLTTIPVIKTLKYKGEFKKIEFCLLIIPIISNILSIVVIFTLAIDDINRLCEQKVILLVISSILFLSNIALIKITGSIVKINKVKMENKLIREKINSQYQRYMTIQESQMKLRKLYHDMNNHISCIEKLYQNKANTSKYIEDIKNELNSWKSIISTGNMILDIIINDKKDICNKTNIDFDVDINFSKCEFIDMIDICSIFSNMIDNAIEACLKLNENNEHRFIRIKGTVVNRLYIIKCENSKVNQVKLRKQKIITNKSDSFFHGIGIKSIESSVKKYDGEVCINFCENKFDMKIYIPLR
ncbi:ATP-binding protein [Paraclostridium sordellii]|uniref:Two-component signal transduction sensor histidine kinase n=1 Tax=Paraclostridium sordellii TaxID=1505 RepID=A0A9P1KYF7_PARSO|nr:ATP-binding protein [Paeniclostridium sordellii]CEN31369.1 two-component signal transduction sensor histidine kinase [[Clostridium] sordellii] [Paeniclostridium sordellii]